MLSPIGSSHNGWAPRSAFPVALICSAFVLSAVSQPRASGYTFVTLAVDFPSFKEVLFGCAATGSNDLGLTVGGCNDQAQNSRFSGFVYDGRRFARIDFNHTKTANPELQTADPLFGKSSYQGIRFLPTSSTHQGRVSNGAVPQDINNSGDITGWFFDGKLRGFFKRNGNVLALDAPHSLFTEAVGINDFGEIVGDYRGEDGPFHGFIYQNGDYATLDVPSGGDTGASGVNNLGQVVGCYSLCSHGFLYDPRTSAFSPIDVPGAVTTQATDINDFGQIVGVYSTDNSTLHAFLYDGHAFTTIDISAFITSPTASTIGQVAGSI